MNEKTYFNLYTSGLGYVNRIRTVTPKRGEPFLCCDIAALSGAADDVDYVHFDCKVTGSEARKLIARCEQAVNEKRKVLIHFRLGDLYVDMFTYSKGERKGETGVSLKARLLYIGLVKIDGEVVWQAGNQEAEAEAGAA
ncbi:DUF3577 domain-containing protein [Salmonella enterica]|uniref:STY4534 family ICE replication protein n=1 Tax=Salmonella enterica TaxID=28901 RepID=UPI0009AA4ECE|nr:STY4534 family ICE replication protein [Salmonella enterica]ECF6099682.1 DUF3577 domain-containing protein [Salmonella enterica subsp. diarizonae]EAP3673759.1 DUF3577 domain-containing protein [Salmonella enterica]EBB1557741.1 DUF3577 domain-containing protein [Salmonella enterica]EBC6121616.1 DUF3577 domain-containing protein [Salmonella enterica]EEH5263420.1 DUF3577 domain-containing protein [Salmonella enterica]